MSKFFDMNTRTLHVVASYAGAVKLSQTIGENAIKVKEFHPADNELPDNSIKLRRQHAGVLEQGFFSTDDRELHHGTYDLTDISNEDLVGIADTVVYR